MLRGHQPKPIRFHTQRNRIKLYPGSPLCLLSLFWCLYMAINVSVQYNGGLLPDIILWTICYYYRGTRLNAMKRFYLYSLCTHLLNVLTIFPPDWGCSEGSDAFRFFFKHISLCFTRILPLLIIILVYLLVRTFFPPQCFESVAFEAGSPEWFFDYDVHTL